MHKKILRELNLQKEKLGAKKFEESLSKAVYIEECMLLLHYFVLKHIPDFAADLVSVISLRTLKWASIP